MAELGDPAKRLRIVHVAGSKGKATTSTHIAKILTAAGFRTGLFTSPHLHSWRERIAINGDLISTEEFAQTGSEVLARAQTLDSPALDPGPVNASQILLAMGLSRFASAGCHFAVVEVGLGGRYDATNVVEPDVAVITELEMEHVAILGPTLADIAWNKGGIIKPGVPVAALCPGAEAEQVLRDIATAQSAPVLMESREWTWERLATGLKVTMPGRSIDGIIPSAPGDHQRQNAALAAVAVAQLQGANLPPSDEAVRDGIARTHLPGHFEVVHTERGGFLLDVAHTPQSIDLLVEALQEVGIDRPRIVAGFLSDKHIDLMVERLFSIASSVTLVPVRSPRSASIAQLRTAAAPLSRRVQIAPQVISALFPANSQAEQPDWTVVTGSSVLVAETREHLGLVERFENRETGPH